jgi:hypothetical protein
LSVLLASAFVGTMTKEGLGIYKEKEECKERSKSLGQGSKTCRDCQHSSKKIAMGRLGSDVNLANVRQITENKQGGIRQYQHRNQGVRIDYETNSNGEAAVFDKR